MGDNSSDEGDAGQLDYFATTEGVIEVFEFDYEDVFDYKWDVDSKNFYSCLFMPISWLGLPYFCCCQKKNLRDDVYCQHVCITQDGIRYVKDKHKTSCRFECQEVGKTTKTVPFDKITDCDVEEPAGAEGPICCLVNRRLSIINVDTASGARGPGPDGTAGHELTLVGLKDTHGFKNLVWKMKRTGGQGVASSGAGAPTQQNMGGGDVTALLARNQQLLEETNRLLGRIAENTRK